MFIPPQVRHLVFLITSLVHFLEVGPPNESEISKFDNALRSFHLPDGRETVEPEVAAKKAKSKTEDEPVHVDVVSRFAASSSTIFVSQFVTMVDCQFSARNFPSLRHSLANGAFAITHFAVQPLSGAIFVAFGCMPPIYSPLSLPLRCP